MIVSKEGRLVASLAPEELNEMKALRAAKNEELYKLQTAVLAWDLDVADAAELEKTLKKCCELEAEIGVLHSFVKESVAATKDGGTQFAMWHSQQVSAAHTIQESLSTLKHEAGGESIKMRSESLAQQASLLESQAEVIVRELHSTLARRDHHEVQKWRRAHCVELKMLKIELAHTRAAGCCSAAIEAKVEACCEDLNRMVQNMRRQGSNSDDSQYSDSDSDSDSDIDSDSDSEEECEEMTNDGPNSGSQAQSQQTAVDVQNNRATAVAPAVSCVDLEHIIRQVEQSSDHARVVNVIHPGFNVRDVSIALNPLAT